MKRPIGSSGLRERPPAGTRVRMTGRFLASTGQQTGSEGLSRWTVLDCSCRMCAAGTHVATDEPHPAALDRRGYEDVPDAERLAMKRHIAIGNLEIVGAPPKAADYDLPIVSSHAGRRAR